MNPTDEIQLNAPQTRYRRWEEAHRDFAIGGLERRLAIIGVPLASL